MFKRILSLLVLLMAVTAFSALAEDEIYRKVSDALYRIVMRTEDGDVTLGSGVLFVDEKVLLTAESCCMDGDLYAIGADGEHRILLWQIAEESGVALMEMLTASSAEPLSLANYSADSLPYLFGVTAQGESGAVPLYQARKAVCRGREALVFSSGEGLLPGAFAVDAKGGVISLVISQQAEGAGMYVGYDPEGIYAAMHEESGTDAFLDASAQWADGLLTISWSEATPEGSRCIVSITGEKNSYYTEYEAEAGKKSMAIIVPPGHTYYYQAQWAAAGQEASDPVWSAMTAYTVPQKDFTGYGFRQECYLSSAPAGVMVSEALPKLENITAEHITGGENDMYLQITNIYDVEEAVELPMTAELIAPDGQFYFIIYGYTFDPAYEQNDVFSLPVQELFNVCAQFSGGSLRPGDYVIRYAIGGQVAGEYAFTLE